jgi:hypothetical protein
VGRIWQRLRPTRPQIATGLRRVRAFAVLLLVALIVITVGAVITSMFTGSTANRGLGVGIAGVALSLIAIFVDRFGELFEWLSGQLFTSRHGVVLAVLLLVFAPLGLTHQQWLPGVLDRCYTLPHSPHANGRTIFVRAGDGECYGLVDSADPGLLTPGWFGSNSVAGQLQQELLDGNRPLRDGDLTVVWLGSLSCTPLRADPTRCTDERDYPAERDQLRALRLAQARFAAEPGHPRLHVVIGNVGQDVKHIDDVASMIIEHRSAYGGRLAVIGGGDSRDVTQRAINRLLDQGIPFIAPNLLADLGGPARPFVQRAGYFQLPPANQVYADDTIRQLKSSYPQGFRLEVFQLPAPTDQYTTSLVNDLLSAVSRPGNAGRIAARHVKSLDQIGSEVCSSSAGSNPTVLFFADRWNKFGDFLHRVNDVCGFSPPRRVMADGSVARFMASTRLRAQSNATWPLDYYIGGLGCGALRQNDALSASWVNQTLHPRGGQYACGMARGTDTSNVYCTLDAAEDVSQPCVPNDLGTFLAPAFDSVMLADALLPARASSDVPTNTQQQQAYLQGLTLNAPVSLTQGEATIHAGLLDKPTIPVRAWHVSQVDNPSEQPAAG